MHLQTDSITVSRLAAFPQPAFRGQRQHAAMSRGFDRILVVLSAVIRKSLRDSFSASMRSGRAIAGKSSRDLSSRMRLARSATHCDSEPADILANGRNQPDPLCAVAVQFSREAWHRERQTSVLNRYLSRLPRKYLIYKPSLNFGTSRG